ncbi:MAG: hypothetical protein K9I48_05605 [Sphingobacteriales bacterium]|nr:hypothetical protein [Sphingobacteriales bacterium]
MKLVLKTGIIILFTFIALLGYANKTNEVYRIKSTANGILKINASTLNSLYPELTNIDPRYFHLQKNGQTIPFYIMDTSSLWNNNNAILFIVKKNDGFLDKQLYDKPGAILNPYFSMYSDTSIYLLNYDETKKGSYYKKAATENSNKWVYNFEYENVNVFSDSYFLGKDVSAGATLSEYTLGEGYSGAMWSKGSSQSRSLDFTNIIPEKEVEIQTYVSGQSNAISGNPNANHHLKVELLGNTTSTLTDTLYKGYQCKSLHYRLNGSLFSTSTNIRFSSINDLSAESDYNTVPYIKYSYTRKSNLQDIKFLNFLLSTNQASNLIFSNAPLDSMILFSEKENEFYTSNTKADSIYFKLGDNNEHSNYTIASIKSNDVISSFAIEKTNMINFDFRNESNDLIIISSRKLETSAKNYQQYKLSKGVPTLLVFAEDLYNTYTFGYHHPLAIKKFVERYSSTAKTPAKNLFIIGKGMQSNTYNTTGIAVRDLVPSVGVPPSDGLYVSSFNYNPIIPIMGIGRLAAENNEEVEDYLVKATEYESNSDDALWRKNIIHATGGRSIGENALFTSALKVCEGISIQPSLGAKVINFNKKVNEPISDNFREKILELTNSGISLLSYFGHGANYFVEINFGEPEALSNQGKYPIYFLNGCAVGNCSLDNSMGENYMRSRNKGAIGWLAASDEGFPSYLSLYAKYFYENAFKNKYGESIGVIQKETIKNFIDASDSLNILHARQYFYQGDPSLRFYSPNNSDYTFANNGLFTTTKSFLNSDSVEFACIIQNLGKAINDSIELQIERTINNQQVITYPIIKKVHVFNIDTFYFTIERTKELSGTNSIKVSIDPNQKIDESNEVNNSITQEIYLSSYKPIIIQPRQLSIVKSKTIHLVVQCSDIYAKDVEYTVEIDTSKLFNTSYLRTYQWTDQQLLRKDLSFEGKENTIYYLRTKIKGNAQESDWEYTSFTYASNNLNTWQQSSTKQLNSELFTNVVLENNNLAFINNTVEFAINTRGDLARTDSIERRLRINNNPPVYLGSSITGIVLFAMHPKNLTRYSYPSGYNLFANTPDYPYSTYKYSGLFVFNTQDPTALDSLKYYLNSIPVGYVVAGYNGLASNLKSLPENVYQAFESIGLAQIRNIEDGYPYTFVGYKGSAIGTAIEKTADLSSGIPPNKQFIRLNYTHTGKWDNGKIRSEIIGPVKKWTSINWNFIKENNDNFLMQVLGIDTNNNYVALRTSTNAVDSISISDVNTNLYSKIQLQSTFKDSINFNPPQFKSWGLKYKLPNEASILPQHRFLLEPNKTMQGDTIRYRFSFINLGEETIDSAQVFLNSIDENRTLLTLKKDTITTLNALDTLTFSYQIPTRAYSGKVKIQSLIDLNEADELIPYNNTFESEVVIDKDIKSPVLSVFIDGKTPMQNDIISPNPDIKITLKDDNKYLLLNDSGVVELYLKNPNENDFKKISYSSPNLTYTTANSALKNEFNLNYHPKLSTDGIYAMKVKVKDASNNNIQNNDYTINFEVINESSITHFFPYPNPFTTQTQFVFTLTGETIPEDIKIQIMTISGKIVKEIRKAELGSIKIGHNITDYRWNGTDEYGDRLANGVYLYRVIIKDNNSFKERATDADKYFSQGFGKIYLMK